MDFIASISTIKTDLSSLGDYQLEELFNYIGEILTVGTSKALLMKSLRSPDLARAKTALIVNPPIYHIHNINALHINLKIWMYKFKGVSSKFLANYMVWYKWLETFNDEKDIILCNIFIIDKEKKCK